jgi:hypothetical protein
MLGALAYLRGDLHRLTGAFDHAEQAYRAAAELDHDTQPGVALLRLAQGRLPAADAAIRRALTEAGDPMTRARLLGHYVDIVTAAGDINAARDAADELAILADTLDQPYVRALAAQAKGTVLLADAPAAALVELRRAWTGWRNLEAPYQAARVRIQVALACRALDDDSATMELDAARAQFAQLGATPDIAIVDALTNRAEAASMGGLTARELEVLALVATG